MHTLSAAGAYVAGAQTIPTGARAPAGSSLGRHCF
jgi:hypothetical protein